MATDVILNRRSYTHACPVGACSADAEVARVNETLIVWQQAIPGELEVTVQWAKVDDAGRATSGGRFATGTRETADADWATTERYFETNKHWR